MTCAAARNSAPRSRYSTASELMTTMSESALLMGWRCRRRLRAPATQSPPKMMKRARCMGFRSSEDPWKNRLKQHRKCKSGTKNCKSLHGQPEADPEAGDNDVGDGDGDEKLPAEAHELVVAEARKRAAHPDIEKEEAEDFGDEPEDREDRREDGTRENVTEERSEGAGPAAEEKQRGDAADGDHVGVFRHEEHGELHGAVLGVITGGELAFGFGQIEGRAVGLREGGHEIDEEGDKLEAAEEVPREESVRRLDVNDVAEAERSGAQNDANERQAESELVADDLGRSAQRAKQRVL